MLCGGWVPPPHVSPAARATPGLQWDRPGCPEAEPVPSAAREGGGGRLGGGLLGGTIPGCALLPVVGLTASRTWGQGSREQGMEHLGVPGAASDSAPHQPGDLSRTECPHPCDVGVGLDHV